VNANAHSSTTTCTRWGRCGASRPWLTAAAASNAVARRQGSILATIGRAADRGCQSGLPPGAGAGSAAAPAARGAAATATNDECNG
jgi:hypothetical protein